MSSSSIYLKEGEQKKIVEFKDEHIASKLISMGLLPGSSIQIVRKAPFNGGFYIKVDGYNYALRTDEVASIMVEE